MTLDLDWTPPPNLGRPEPWLVRFVRQRVDPAMRLLFRPHIEGLEQLPTDRPYVLVANHSAGMAVAELTCIAALLSRQPDPLPPLAGFAHPIGFRIWPVSWVQRALGSVPSTYDAAHMALEQKVPLLVFPGGDRESLRPLWQVHTVDFGGRRGFLRIAQQAQVPVVPMGIRGSHFTAPILFRTPSWPFVIPWLMGFKRWGVSALGLFGAVSIMLAPWPLWVSIPVAWAWLGTVLTLLPWIPWTLRFRVGAPIEAQDLFSKNDPELAAALARVEGAVQSLVDR